MQRSSYFKQMRYKFIELKVIHKKPGWETHRHTHKQKYTHTHTQAPYGCTVVSIVPNLLFFFFSEICRQMRPTSSAGHVSLHSWPRPNFVEILPELDAAAWEFKPGQPWGCYIPPSVTWSYLNKTRWQLMRRAAGPVSCHLLKRHNSAEAVSH